MDRKTGPGRCYVLGQSWENIILILVWPSCAEVLPPGSTVYIWRILIQPGEYFACSDVFLKSKNIDCPIPYGTYSLLRALQGLVRPSFKHFSFPVPVPSDSALMAPDRVWGKW